VILGGEIKSVAKDVDVEGVVRRVIREVGYDCEANCFDGQTVEVLNKLHTQSFEIDGAVSKDGDIGAGDQGLMFGYACDETGEYMPLGHVLAFRLIRNLEHHFHNYRHSGNEHEELFLPDAKTQVTLLYGVIHGRKKADRVETIVVSTSHRKDLSEPELRKHVLRVAVKPLLEVYGDLFVAANHLINPGGLWTFCGPAADTGLTGRKLVVDNYGPYCPIGGGCFSGKDPTKVDRSAAYAARYIAKNIVAAKLSNEAQVQLSYAIGHTKPVSVRIRTDVPIAGLDRFIMERLDLSPRGIIERFQLRRPIYQQTASGGHFGNPAYPWEQLD